MSSFGSIINSTINSTTNNNQFSSTIIYREGEPNPNNINIFSTLSGAVNKAQSIGPNTYVFIDPSLGVPKALANTTYNINNLILTGGNDGGVLLSIQNGAKFTGGALYFIGLSLLSSSNSSVIDASSSGCILTLDKGSSLISTNSSFIMTDSSSGFTSLLIRYFSFILNFGGTIITANSTNGVGIFTDYATAVTDNTLAGPESITVEDLTGSLSNPTLTGPGLAFISKTQLGTNISYS